MVKNLSCEANGGTCCWHHNGYTMTSNPPQWDETCCNCGAQRRRSEDISELLEQHGPHMPGARQFVWRVVPATAGRTAHCPCRRENGGSGICGCVLGSTVTWTASA